MALTENTVLRSVTVSYEETPSINIAKAHKVLRDDQVIAETIHRATYQLVDYNRMLEEEPELAEQYGGLLGWTTAKADSAREERRRRLDQERLEAERMIEQKRLAE